MQASAFKVGDRFSEDTADFFAVQHYIVYPLDTGFYSAYLFDGSYNRYSRTCGNEERFVGFEIGAEKHRHINACVGRRVEALSVSASAFGLLVCDKNGFAWCAVFGGYAEQGICGCDSILYRNIGVGGRFFQQLPYAQNTVACEIVRFAARKQIALVLRRINYKPVCP